MKIRNLEAPLAITMWDFSWLERRWPGAGYECWDTALDELAERGYNAVRIDAYPHLVSRGPEKEWTIIPCWNQQDWGSPALNKVTVQPNLNAFIHKCKERGIQVGLSTWFQLDQEDSRRYINSPLKHAEFWQKTLDTIDADDLLDAILFVDLCNEWPLDCWVPFFKYSPDNNEWWTGPESLNWINESISALRKSYPDLAYTYSHTGCLGFSEDQISAVRAIDFLEPHIWMVHGNNEEFNKRISYFYERFESKGYENVVKHARKLYETDPGYWKTALENHTDKVCAEAKTLGLPMITTECWGIVDYKDWPLLDWNWVKDICAHGVQYAASKGQWLAISTSNFCGPQFVGMWRDKDWHLEMTKAIKSAQLPQYDSQTKHWKS